MKSATCWLLAAALAAGIAVGAAAAQAQESQSKEKAEAPPASEEKTSQNDRQGARQNSSSRGEGRGWRESRGNRERDPEEMRERMARYREEAVEGYREILKASDEDWKTVRPLLNDAIAKQWSQSGSGFGRSRRSVGGSDPSPEGAALSGALEAGGASAADLKAKMAALREARKKQQTELREAREKRLRKVLSLRQEALLLLSGVLD